jgi:hypothetical protein
MAPGPFPPNDGTGIYPVTKVNPAPPDEETVDGEPNDGWTNAQIQAYATEHGIDLGGATKKADMLAAIAEAS